MSKREIKCSNCGQWTPGEQIHCVHCGALVDPQVIDQQKRAFRKEEQLRNKKETAFEKYLNKLKQSQNPFLRFLFHVLNVVWMVYMAIVAFIVWFTTIFTG